MKYVPISVATSFGPTSFYANFDRTEEDDDNDDVDVGGGGRPESQSCNAPLHALLIFIFLLARVNLVT